MFYSIRGQIIQCVPTDTHFHAVIECNGIGFEIRTSYHTANMLPAAGNEAKLYTYLHVREDAMELSGFSSLEELNCYKLLISVSGVGQRAALAILSGLDPNQFALSVASGDYKSFTKVKGIGAKIAQRIVLELKDKINKDAAVSSVEINSIIDGMKTDNSSVSEAINALAVLGYSQSEAAKAIAGLDKGLTVEELIKRGLKILGNLA